ncbi:hypothetical protein BH09ACT7_BH09ACT7_03640 [soil metagenome]
MSLRDLENETAEELLNAIKAQTRGQSAAGLVELANAYAAVVGVAPGPEPRAPRVGK